MAKVLLSLSDRLLRQIDRAAASQGLSRSAYVARLAERDTQSRHTGRAPAVRAALHELDRLFSNSLTGESTALIRAERDAR